LRPRTRFLEFCRYGTVYATHREQASLIRLYIIWRNDHA
jgi:hypothetical protein